VTAKTAAGRALLEAMHSDACDPPCLSYLQAASDRAPFVDLVTAIEDEAGPMALREAAQAVVDSALMFSSEEMFGIYPLGLFEQIGKLQRALADG
jgi:hypothetical protein